MLRPLPEQVHGTDATVDVQLRRLFEGTVLSEAEAGDFVMKELQKVCNPRGPSQMFLKPSCMPCRQVQHLR